MDSSEKEELIQEFLLIMEIGNILKITINDYEERLTDVLKRTSIIEKINANSIFDVLQSLEGLNSSQYEVSQKLLYVLSKLKIEENISEEKENINEEKENINKEKKIIKNKIENKLINNALSYLKDKFSQKEEEDNE